MHRLVTAAGVILVVAQLWLPRLLDPGSLVAQGRAGETTVRIASAAALGAYLVVIPIALGLRDRFRDAEGIRQFTIAGLLYAYLGLAGALVMLVVGTPLLDLVGQYPKGPNPVTDFNQVYNIAVVGIWEVIEPVLAALWLIPIGIAGGRAAQVT